MKLADLAQWLEDSELGDFRSSESGGNIFLNRVPATPDNIISLFSTGGLGDTGDFDSLEPNPTVQFRIRNTLSNEAENLAWDLYFAVQRLNNVSLGETTHIIDSDAIQEPFWLARDTDKRTEYAFNVRFRTQEI